MKRLLRAFLVLTFLFGQVAFALPDLSTPMDFGGNRHVNKSFVEHATGCDQCAIPQGSGNAVL
jgi:hypothetical protein